VIDKQLGALPQRPAPPHWLRAGVRSRLYITCAWPRVTCIFPSLPRLGPNFFSFSLPSFYDLLRPSKAAVPPGLALLPRPGVEHFFICGLCRPLPFPCSSFTSEPLGCLSHLAAARRWPIATLPTTTLPILHCRFPLSIPPYIADQLQTSWPLSPSICLPPRTRTPTLIVALL
jgi:hypothetical protein